MNDRLAGMMKAGINFINAGIRVGKSVNKLVLTWTTVILALHALWSALNA